MGPMGKKERQLALGTTAGRKLSWGGFRYGCLDPEEPRIIPGAAYLFTGFGDAFWLSDVPVGFPLAGSNCYPAVRVWFNFSQEEGRACLRD